MNVFDQNIQQSQIKHKATLILVAAIVTPAALLLTLWLLFAKGYNIIVAPEKVAPYVVLNVISGFGFFYHDKLYVLSGDAQISASAIGYHPHTETLSKASASTITIELLAKPGRVEASTIPDSPKNHWSLDGRLLQVAKELAAQVAPGQHVLTLNSPYYQVIEESFEILNDQQLHWQFELKPVNGQVVVDSKPQGAAVTINADVVGKTPLFVDRLGGEHHLVVSLPGYESINERFSIVNDNPRFKRDYQLVAKKGLANFALQPNDGTLLVDGQLISETMSVPLASNTPHTVIYQKPGYFSSQQRITVQADVVKTVSIELKREFGQVVFTSTPTTLVLVDGKPFGQTPVETSLSAEPHHIEFKKAGYRTAVIKIKPTSKNTTLVNPSLLTEYDARRLEKKQTESEKLGIAMSQFRPDKVLLGSKANEIGRRRNEFLRPVTFSRAVAVSRHEITEAQFEAFSKGSGAGKSQLPVTDVTWLQAVQFCNWLSVKDGLLPFYLISGGHYQGVDVSSEGYRLPTEAEWEWLAKRAKRAVETKYVWGDIDRLPDGIGNLSDESSKEKNTFYFKDYNDSHEGKAPVGSFKADRIGLFDLVGNVSEWVHDIYTNVPPNSDTPLRDPLGPKYGNSHLYKGSNFESGRLKELRVGWREVTVDKAPYIGFRIARYIN